jgi:hypothetical protein
LLGPISSSLFGLSSFNVALDGNSQFLGIKGQTTPFSAYDNADASVNLVPEPSTLALAGAFFGVFGIGWAAYRRKAKA